MIDLNKEGHIITTLNRDGQPDASRSLYFGRDQPVDWAE